MRRVISLVARRGDAVLLVYKRDVWLFPGGKPLPGEGDLDCLRRELKEELPSLYVNWERVELWLTVPSAAPHQKDHIAVTFYRCPEIDGYLSPAAEITAAALVRDPSGLHLAESTEFAMEQLFKDGYLRG